jgi:hypothetical protein
MFTVAMLAGGPLGRFWQSQPGILTILRAYAGQCASRVASFAERLSAQIGDEVKETG